MKAWFKRWILGRSDTEPATYFAHIPKTAGTSFIVLLDRFFHHDAIFPHQLWREVKAIDPTENQSYDLFRGHFGGGGLHVLTTRPVRYLTLLRDPIELSRSTFQYVKRETNTQVHELVSPDEFGFGDFLQHEKTQPLVQNRMVRNLSFDFDQDPAAQEVFLSAETIHYLQSVMDAKSSDLNDDDRLQRAHEFIRQARWFGLVERFDESMQLLCFAMGWPPVGPSQKLNVVKQKQPLTAAEMATLHSVNAQDIELYREAQALFKERLDDMHQHLNQFRTHDHQNTDDLLDIHYQKHRQGALSGPLRYDFAEPLLGSQWHRRELMSPEQEHFRWTGPRPAATIDFWLEPNDYTLKVRIINAVNMAVLNQLVVTLNGHELMWQTDQDGVVRVLTMQVTRQMMASHGLARLQFQCPEVISHQQAFGSDDQRLVGVAVHWIQFSHD